MSAGTPHAPGLNVECPHCGQVHTRCIGHRESKVDGHIFPCGRINSDGHQACYGHGGPRTSKARTRARKAAIRPRSKATSQAIATLEVLAVPIETNPIDALMGLLAKSNALVLLLEEEWAKLARPQGGELVTTERLAMHPLWGAWREESEREARFADLLVRAGFQERQVRVIEQQATLFADLVRKVLDDPDLGLSDAQRQTGRRIAATQLRLVGGSG